MRIVVREIEERGSRKGTMIAEWVEKFFQIVRRVFTGLSSSATTYFNHNKYVLYLNEQDIISMGLKLYGSKIDISIFCDNDRTEMKIPSRTNIDAVYSCWDINFPSSQVILFGLVYQIGECQELRNYELSSKHRLPRKILLTISHVMVTPSGTETFPQS